MNNYHKIVFFKKTTLIIIGFFVVPIATMFFLLPVHKVEAQTLTTYVLLGAAAADNDGGCPSGPNYGATAASYFNNPGVSIGGYGNRQTFDCAAISLASDGTYAPNIDIRFGVTVSDQPCTSGTGQVAWTPWASQGGGASPHAYEPGNNDPDCIGTRIETRSLPGFILGPLRAGIRLATAQPSCNIDEGATRYTTWSPTPSIQTSPWALKASGTKLAPCVSVVLNMAPPIAPTTGAQYVPPTDIPSSYLPNETKTGNYRITMRNTGSTIWVSDQRARISSSGTCQTAVGGSSVPNAPNLGSPVGTSCTTQYWFSSSRSYLEHTGLFGTPPVWRYQHNASETISIDEEWVGRKGACVSSDDDSAECMGRSRKVWDPDAGPDVYNNIYAYSYNRSPNIVKNDSADFYGSNCGAGCFSPSNYLIAPGAANTYNETWTMFLNGSDIGSAIIPLAVNPPAGPDLTAGAPTPNTATIGTPQAFTSTITNSGSVATGATFFNSLQVATGSCEGLAICPTAVSPLIASNTSPMSALAASASQTATAFYPFASAGTRSVRFCADNNTSMVGSVDEGTNEGNNCSGWRDVIVSAAAVPATANIKANGSDAPPDIVYGGTADITWTSLNATSCTVTPPNWTGTSAISGTHVLTGLTAPVTIYGIYCDPPAGGSYDDQVVVNVQAQTFGLNVIKSGQGVVTSLPVGINCGTGSGCQANFDKDTEIRLTAIPAIGRIFTGWSSVVCSGIGENQRSPTCTFIITNNLTVYANFIADPNYGEF